MPSLSAELRWFFRGAPPPEAVAWFRALAPGPVPAAERRTDRYLPVLHPDEPGVKGRGGKEGGTLDVKQRTRTLGMRRPGPSVAGHAEAWRKWSVEAEGAAPRDWLAVAKTRRLRTFAVVGEAVEVVRRGAHPARGANVELTRLRLDGQAWWSICIEAFAAEVDDAEAALTVVARHVFGCADAPALPAAASMGYPAWLWRAAREV